jgi:hypothetical protein
MNCFGLLLGAVARFVLLPAFRVENVIHKEYMMVLMIDEGLNSHPNLQMKWEGALWAPRMH